MDDRHTVSVKREKMAQDYAALRRRYEDHRQTIVRLAAEAPTERLAMRYEDAKRELDAAIIKLEELEHGSHPPPNLPPAFPVENRPTAPGTYPSRGTLNSPLERSLRTTQSEPGAPPVLSHPREDSTVSRTLLIIGAGILALGLLGFFVWKFALGKDAGTGSVTSKQAAVTETIAEGEMSTAEPAAETPHVSQAAAGITITPMSQDFGRIQKGARAARQFEIVNSTGGPLGLRLARSKCRCLWFEYPDKIEAGRSTLTVTLDASKANKGELAETIKVSSPPNPAVAGTITVTAKIE